MSILTGFLKTKKYRKTDSGYKLQSEWTSAETVQMASGITLETALGGKQIRVLTKAQYDALSADKKNDTTVIYLYY